jgi:hypothetical protein
MPIVAHFLNASFVIPFPLSHTINCIAELVAERGGERRGGEEERREMREMRDER